MSDMDFNIGGSNIQKARYIQYMRERGREREEELIQKLRVTAKPRAAILLPPSTNRSRSLPHTPHPLEEGQRQIGPSCVQRKFIMDRVHNSHI
jgi:hypothetical protein